MAVTIDFSPLLATLRLSRGTASAIVDQLRPAAVRIATVSGVGLITGAASMIEAIDKLAVSLEARYVHFTFDSRPGSNRRFDARHRGRDEARVLREAIVMTLQRQFEPIFYDRQCKKQQVMSDSLKGSLSVRLLQLDRLLNTSAIDRIAALAYERVR